MQTEAQCAVNAVIVYRHERHLRDLVQRFRVARSFDTRKFPLRQGLWIEDLQIPPGQECSNGSTILLAVVLWRAFFGKPHQSVRGGPAIRNETSQDQNGALLPDNRRLRQAAGLHVVAKTLRRPPPPIANQEQPGNDNPEK